MALKRGRGESTGSSRKTKTKSLGAINLFPEKYRRLIRTVETNEDVAADYDFPDGLTGDQSQVTLAQKTITEARLKIVEEVIEIDADPLVGHELSEWGSMIITESIVDDGSAIDTGFNIVKSTVTPLGNGKSIKITVQYPSNIASLALLKKSIGQDNLTPEKYRRLVQRTTTEKEVATSYTFPTALAGNQTQIQYAEENIYRARLTIIEETVGTGSGLVGEETDEQWGDLVINESIVDEGTAVSEGLMVKKSTVTPLGNGKAVKIVVSYVAFPTLYETDVDEKNNIVSSLAKTIVAAGTAGGVAGNVVTEVKPIDKWRSVRIVSVIDESTLPDPVTLPIMEDHSFPDQLIGITVLAGKGLGQSVGQDASLSFSWDGELSLQIINGYRGPCPGTLYRAFSVGIPTFVPEETVILPATGTAVIFGGSFTIEGVSGSARFNSSTKPRAITIPAVLTTGIKKSGKLIDIPTGASSVFSAFSQGAGISVDPGTLGGSYDINVPASTPVQLRNHQPIITRVTCERYRGNIFILEIVTLKAVVGNPFLVNALPILLRV